MLLKTFTVYRDMYIYKKKEFGGTSFGSKWEKEKEIILLHSIKSCFITKIKCWAANEKMPPWPFKFLNEFFLSK